MGIVLVACRKAAITGSKPIVDPNIAPLDPSQVPQSLLQGLYARLCFRIIFADPQEQADAPHPIELLRARRERPSHRRTAEERDELAPFHLIEWHPIHASQCGIAGYRTGDRKSDV